jgi:hypothetical protein
MSLFNVTLQFPEKYDPSIRAELEQIVAALQVAGNQRVPLQNGGLGLDASDIDNGELLIGNGILHEFALRRLGAGPGITISVGPGTITISANGAILGAGYAPMSTGAEPLEIMSDGAGQTLMVAFDP